MAGQIAELARDSLRRDFRSIDTQKARVLLLEAAEQVLGTFPEPLRRKATNALERLGVTPLPGHAVVEITAESVDVRKPDGEVERIGTHTVVSTPGCQPPLAFAVVAFVLEANGDPVFVKAP